MVTLQVSGGQKIYLLLLLLSECQTFDSAALRRGGKKGEEGREEDVLGSIIVALQRGLKEEERGRKMDR